MDKDTGWIKLHRKIEESEMYQRMNAVQRSILLDILLSVNWKEKEWDYKGEHYSLKPGQMVTSLDKLKARCAKDVSIRNLRTCLKMMKDYGFLTNHSTKQNRTLTICNWEKYQGQATNEVTSGVTDERQTSDKQVTTIEERKKEKKEKKEEILPTVVEPKAPKEFGNGEVNELWWYWVTLYGGIPDGRRDYNRRAAYTLYKRHGMEKAKKLVSMASTVQGEPYSPKICSFMDLRDGETALKRFMVQRSNKQPVSFSSK